MTASPPTSTDRPPTPWTDNLGRAGARAGQLLLIAAVMVGVVWLLLRVQVVVVSVLVALILASAVAPLVKWLIGKGWSRMWATIASFFAIVVVASGVVSGIVLAIRSEWDRLVSSAVDGWEQLNAWISSLPLPVDTSMIDDAAQQVTNFVTSEDFAASTLTGVSAATEFLTGVVLIVVLLFFFLKDGSSIWNFVLRWFRGETRAKLAESVDRASGVLGGYVRGTATVALVDAMLIGIGLVIVGVPLAVPLAVIVFIGAFIPVVGATVAGILAAAVTVVTTGPIEALIVVAIVIAVNQVEGNLLQPVVMARTLSLHPLIVLLALTIGTIVGGIFGAILAVPYTAMAWTLIQIWTERYQAGDDPVLGKDPLDPRSHAGSKASWSQRVKHRRLRRKRPRGSRLGAVEQEEAEDPRESPPDPSEAPEAR
ncbi:MAG: AI-2E family transporter [Brachybacterium sp.]|uniref:AI-2E family transporter n=1 Tax=Brachybacterium sp. TaxID=1891286 RepID=UPI00264AEAA9|nr:AI-2E family transporter [Brachybacterium sp.]MDN6301575.1 AI-2E family transporter [Brachybacterium sp.]MDN6327982.1 AI-2E family transporter [Brachybacterium sp.]